MPSGAFRKKKTSYAQVSNVALRDEALSLKAKGLLALIESYITLENFTLYKQFLINKSTDGETSFRGAWKELKDRGYLIQYKLKDPVTKKFYYEYELCDNPTGDLNIGNSSEPEGDFPHVGNLHGGKATCGKPPLYNNTVNINTVYINNIRTNIDYAPVFVNSSDKELVDNIVNIMADALTSESKVIKINGDSIKGDVLRSMLWKVNMYHISYTMDVLRKYDGEIKNMKKFILSVLYNSVLTLECCYQNKVNGLKMG